MKKFSQSCCNNQQPIFEQLSHLFLSKQRVLEIGSGTGQHAVFFASKLPHLQWHTSDLIENHQSINAWIAASPSDNLHPPVELMIGQDPWPPLAVDAVFTANSTHIMQANEAKLMMQLIAKNLSMDGIFCQYGPFKIEGEYTSDSNRDFDAYLKESDFGGLRDLSELKLWAKGMNLVQAIPMPANNFLLLWRK